MHSVKHYGIADRVDDNVLTQRYFPNPKPRLGGPQQTKQLLTKEAAAPVHYILWPVTQYFRYT